MIGKKRISLFSVFVLFVLCTVSFVHSDPIFVPRADTTGCEGEGLSLSIYADALFSEDELEFEMEGAPDGAFLENYGKCG